MRARQSSSQRQSGISMATSDTVTSPMAKGMDMRLPCREGGGARKPVLPSATHMEGEVADPVEVGNLLPAARDLQHHGEGHDEAG